MTQLIISLLLFILITGSVMLFLAFKKDYSSFNQILYAVLVIAWIAMFMFKTNPNLSHKGFIGNHWWSWPIIISLYQFTQVAVRLPIGIISQKLKSRKEPLMLVMFILLIGLVIVIASNFADWAIIIGVICTGVMASSFGLNAQYWSENWNIKRGFTSAVIVFTIPFVAQMFAQFMNSSFSEGNINLFWITFTAAALLTVNFIVYSLFVKEDKNTIFLDNMDSKAKPFTNKSMYDVMVISLATAMVVGSFTFVTYLGFTLAQLNSSQKLIFPAVQIFFIIMTPLIFLKMARVVNVSLISQIVLFISSIILTMLIATDNITVVGAIILISIINAAFGTYFGLMFSATLHFDHKYPALVMGIFLTIKSFFTGSANISSQLLADYHSGLSLWTLGWIAFSTTTLLTLSSVYLSMRKYVLHKETHTINSLLEESYKFEESSSKIVNSNKNVKK